MNDSGAVDRAIIDITKGIDSKDTSLAEGRPHSAGFVFIDSDQYYGETLRF